MKKRQIIGVLLAFISFLFIFFSPGLKDLSAEGQRCLALFVMVFFLYSFEVMDAAIISIAIVPLLVIFRITSIKDALAGFSSSSTYLIVGAFLLTAAMVKSKVGNRITYHILLLVGTNARNISFGIMCVNLLLAFMIPSSTARTAMMLPICLNIIKQYHGTSKTRTKFGANIMMTLCCTNSTISSGILTSTITNPMAVEYIQNAIGQTVTYRQWLIWGGPPALLCTLLAWILIQLFFRSEKPTQNNEVEYIKTELNRLGKISGEEKRVLIILGAAVVLWFLSESISLDSTTICLLCGCILCIPKLGNLNWKDCKENISISVMFVVSGGISLGAAMNNTGTATWLAENIFKLLGLENLSASMLIIAMMVIVQFMHIFFAGTATMANVFFPVIAGIATVSGVSPLVLILISAFMIGGYPILMFFNTTPNILCYDTGQLTSGDFLKYGLALSVVACLVYSVCVKWYWPLIGLL